jgi:FtsZ-binding cell division protein ZapB
MAQKGSIKIALGEKTITLHMTTKEDKAKKSMLTQEESEVQDNIRKIINDRNQVKALGYNGMGSETTNGYEKETNAFLHGL